MRTYFNNVTGAWIVLFALFLPFTYNFFPQLGIDLTNGLSNISEWIAETIFGVKIYASPTTSDSSAQFVQALLLLIFAALISVLLLKQKRFKQEKLKQFLHAAASYILSFFLLKYGVDKLFQFQFYAPEPNTLFTPLGMLSKDILFWSSMGTSASYNTFMGLIEIIPALLLLHHRTRLLGGFIALGVLVNVLMINIGFDITVKLLSTYLMIVSFYVLSPFIKSLYSFFIADEHRAKPNMRLSLRPKAKVVLKAVIVILLFSEVLFSYVKMGSFDGREMEKIAYFGSYELTEIADEILSHQNVKRIHIHSKGYVILEDRDGNFTDYPIRIAPDLSILVRKENVRIYVDDLHSITNFQFQYQGNTTNIRTKRIDLNSLPARDDSFHWTVDGLIESSGS